MGEDIAGKSKSCRRQREPFHGNKFPISSGSNFRHQMLVRIPHDPRNTRKSCDFKGSPLRVASGYQNPRFRILPLRAPDRRACVMIRRRGYRAGVQDYNVCMGWRVSGFKTAFHELALDGGAIRLRGAAAEVLQKEPRHIEDYNFFRASSNPQLTTFAGCCGISMTAV